MVYRDYASPVHLCMNLTLVLLLSVLAYILATSFFKYSRIQFFGQVSLLPTICPNLSTNMPTESPTNNSSDPIHVNDKIIFGFVRRTLYRLQL